MKKNDRVRITNQNSPYRNHLGTVKRVGRDFIWVRIDGHERSGEVPFKKGDLGATTFEEAYSDYEPPQPVE